MFEIDYGCIITMQKPGNVAELPLGNAATFLAGMLCERVRHDEDHDMHRAHQPKSHRGSRRDRAEQRAELRHLVGIDSAAPTSSSCRCSCWQLETIWLIGSRRAGSGTARTATARAHSLYEVAAACDPVAIK